MFENIPIQPIRRQGAVGIANNSEGWRGVHIGDFSNPIAFGEQLWDILQENWKSLDRWSKQLLNYGFWSEFRNDGFCPFCGKCDVGQPRNITGFVLNQFKNNGPKSMAPDPHCNGHSHHSSESTVSSIYAQADGVFLEWIYVLDPKTYNLSVLRAVRTKGTFKASVKGRKWDQGKYRYYQLETFNLMGNEPDWELVEEQGLKVSRYYHQKYAPPRRTAFL